MKQFLIAIFIFSLIVLAVALNTVFVARGIEKSIKEIESIPLPSTSAEEADLHLQAELALKAQANWRRRLKFLSLSIHHHDAMQASEHLASLCGAAQANDPQAYTQTLSILKDAFMHIKELNTPSIWSVL